ncbi:MAG: hypothetical protein QOI74_1488 [Micromonosporaceae bacterium]|nr:hypothetical protein [Micromonosporaceae bacterium]
MESGQPSRTAYAAAAHRATHQVVESGRIFTDPLAVDLLGRDPADLAGEAAANPTRRLMRLFIAVRTRFAEDALAAAVATGTRQLVILGAGLDTFAYRNPHATVGLRVFEVDHPATQEWKRARLAQADITVPPALTFAPVDFESGTLADGLAAAGFDPGVDTFFSWLGVVPYLTREAIVGTLRLVGGLGAASQVVFDYAEPPDSLPPDRRAAYEVRAGRVAGLGEPWISHFDPAELAGDLRGLGFDEIEDLGPEQIAARYFGLTTGRGGRAGGHVIRAGHPRTG